MKRFSKIFAVIALAWAILSFLVLPALDASYGVGPMSRSAHHMAQDLRSGIARTVRDRYSRVSAYQHGGSSTQRHSWIWPVKPFKEF